MSDLLKGFRDFIMRGNVVDLAVAVVIGAAFTAVVNAVVKGLITPLIAAIVGEPSFASLSFTINNAEFLYGTVLDELITFLAIAAVVYFVIVNPMNLFQERMKRGNPPADAPNRPCPECLSDIPKEAKRCSFCTSPVTPDVAGLT